MSKYHAVKVQEHGYTFASKAEHRRYRQLLLLQTGTSGTIGRLEIHPRFPLIVKGVKCGYYEADFRYKDYERDCVIVEDVKGVLTPVYRLKKKLVKALYGIDIAEIDA